MKFGYVMESYAPLERQKLGVGILRAWIFLIGIAGLIGDINSAGAQTPSAINSIFRSAQVVNANIAPKASQIREIEQAEAQDPTLQHWAKFLRAQLLMKQGEREQAFSLLIDGTRTAPVSLDARVALLKYAAAPVAEPGNLDSVRKAIGDVDGLEQDVRLVGRSDLIPEIALARARELRRSGALAAAFDRLLSIREDFRGKPAAQAAKQECFGIRILPEFSALPEKAELDLREAEIFTAEGDLLTALNELQALQATLNTSSPIFFRSRLIEERVLRAMSRPAEANHLLLTISAEGGIGTADQALLRMAKNAWGNNENTRAIQSLERLKKRFPTSPLINEATYVQARIAEEINSFSDAEDLYRAIVNSASDTEEKVRALKRIAWIALQRKMFAEAARSFEQLRLLIERYENEPTERSRIASLREEKRHTTYWLAYSLHKQKPAKGKSSAQLTADAITLWNGLLREDPFGYYGLLARRSLETNRLALTESAVSPAGTPSTEGCKVSSNRIVTALADGGLIPFARAEIDAQILATNRPLLERLSGGPANGTLSDEFLRQAACGAKAYLFAKDFFRGITFARSALRFRDSSVTREEEASYRELNTLSFPTPYEEQFRLISEKEGVPAPLLLGITRSESYFDAKALSRVGALGLMQLMPSTATAEGMNPYEDPYNPSVNIRLGAKHLARLIKLYDGKEVYVIAAYNAGVSAVNRWRTRFGNLDAELWSEMIGYPETANYVKNVVLARAVYTAKK